MADNVTIPATGTGTATPVVATDDVGGAHYQKLKLADGAADSSEMIGGTAANGLDVDQTRPSANVTASGALGAAEATVAVRAEGAGSIAWEIDTGTLSGTVVFEATLDDSNWFGIDAVRLSSGGQISSTASFPDRGHMRFNGWSQVRLRVSAYTSGTSNARLEASAGAGRDPVVDTELPAAGSLTDNMSNPTAPFVAAAGMVWDGSTWDRAPGNATDGLKVNLGVDNDVVVSATDLDIRNLTTTDEVTVKGGAADGAAPVGNPVLIAGFDTTNVQSIHTDTSGDLQVDVLTMPSTTVTATDLDIRNLDVAQDDVRVGGMAAHDAAVADNPVVAGGRASTALPTAVNADGDAVWAWLNRNGAVVIAAAPHLGLNGDPFTLLSETAQYTTTQTSTVLVAGGAGDRLIVTKVQIQVGGTTAGTMQLYFGTGAYVRGTDEAIFDGEFAPSATLKPGVIMDGPFRAGALGDDILVTTSAAINPLTVTVWYYIATV